MKIAFFFVIFVLIYLFIDRYDLYVMDNSSSDTYTIKEKGLYLESTCKSKGEAFKLPYRCVGISVWSEIRGAQHEYNKEYEPE